ncbi:MAG: cell division protein FtsL [Nitrospirota bacterium]
MITRVRAWCRRPRSVWVIWGLVLALSVAALWHHHRTIQLGYETERLQADKTRLERLQRQLLIERESLASLDRIEPLARAMGLTHTPPRDAVVMRLPEPSSEDGRTLVAAVGRGVLPTQAHAAP